MRLTKLITVFSAVIIVVLVLGILCGIWLHKKHKDNDVSGKILGHIVKTAVKRAKKIIAEKGSKFMLLILLNNGLAYGLCLIPGIGTGAAIGIAFTTGLFIGFTSYSLAVYLGKPPLLLSLYVLATPHAPLELATLCIAAAISLRIAEHLFSQKKLTEKEKKLCIILAIVGAVLLIIAAVLEVTVSPQIFMQMLLM